MEEIPPELILNWDQTGLKIVPSNTRTIEEQGLKRVDVAGANDKQQITAGFCGSLVGDFLSFTRVKPHTAILTLNFRLTGTSHTLRNTGQTRRP